MNNGKIYDSMIQLRTTSTIQMQLIVLQMYRKNKYRAINMQRCPHNSATKCRIETTYNIDNILRV